MNFPETFLETDYGSGDNDGNDDGNKNKTQEAKEDAERTPLQHKLDEFGDTLTWIIGVICVAVREQQQLFRASSQQKQHERNKALPLHSDSSSCCNVETTRTIVGVVAGKYLCRPCRCTRFVGNLRFDDELSSCRAFCDGRKHTSVFARI